MDGPQRKQNNIKLNLAHFCQAADSLNLFCFFIPLWALFQNIYKAFLKQNPNELLFYFKARNIIICRLAQILALHLYILYILASQIDQELETGRIDELAVNPYVRHQSLNALNHILLLNIRNDMNFERYRKNVLILPISSGYPNTFKRDL